MKNEKDTDTEQLILETAERLFLEKGYAMTSTTEIAKEAGCNQALVHYYFRTKDKLFQLIFEKKATLFLSSFLQNTGKNLALDETIKLIIETHFDTLKANPKIPFLFLNELSTDPKRLVSLLNKKRNDSLLSYLTNLLEEEARKGNIRPISPIDLLLSIISLNAISFLVKPLFDMVLNISEEEYGKMLEKRKQENVLMILRSLKNN